MRAFAEAPGIERVIFLRDLSSVGTRVQYRTQDELGRITMNVVAFDGSFPCVEVSKQFERADIDLTPLGGRREVRKKFGEAPQMLAAGILIGSETEIDGRTEREPWLVEGWRPFVIGAGVLPAMDKQLRLRQPSAPTDIPASQ